LISVGYKNPFRLENGRTALNSINEFFAVGRNARTQNSI
jgi:hypothetical protein